MRTLLLLAACLAPACAERPVLMRPLVPNAEVTGPADLRLKAYPSRLLTPGYVSLLGTLNGTLDERHWCLSEEWRVGEEQLGGYETASASEELTGCGDYTAADCCRRRWLVMRWFDEGTWRVRLALRTHGGDEIDHASVVVTVGQVRPGVAEQPAAAGW